MSYIEFDSPIKTFGEAKAIIMINGEGIDSFAIPAPIDAEKSRDSIRKTISNFEYENINYEITITSSNLGTYIIIEAEIDNDDINDFEIFIDYQTEKESIIKKELKMDLYVPTLSFTNTTSSILYGLTSEKVIPLIDIETEDKFSSYQNDEIIMDLKHFLDISSMKEMRNREEREAAKLARKEEKKELGKMVTIIPKPVEKFIQPEAKINHLKNIENKENITPVFKWDDINGSLDNLKSFIRTLDEGYKEIGIRVTSIRTFFQYISEISKLHDIHLILDLNTNFDSEKIKNLILDAQGYPFVKIIYIGAQFNTEDISISRDDTNENIISSNQPLLVYESILQDVKIAEDIGYGDYCGFDRKTITEMPSGGRGTARVVLSSLDDSMKLLIRRGWSDQDVTIDQRTGRTKLGYGHSMRKLLQDIQEGELDTIHNIIFMDEELCEADYSLKDFYPEITTPGIIKTLCFRHNVFSIVNTFKLIQNP